jgi:hypothetical protein
MQNCYIDATHKDYVISYREQVYTQALLNFSTEDKCSHKHATQGHYLLSFFHSRGRYTSFLPKGVAKTKPTISDKLIMD